jgi:hypothetical protein
MDKYLLLSEAIAIQPLIITIGNNYRFVNQKSIDKTWIDTRKT